MKKLFSLSQVVRALFFGVRDETLTNNGNRGGNTLSSPAKIQPAESPSKENVSPDEGLLACSKIEKDKQEEDSSMMNRFPWDIYEAVMLLEAYLEIEKYPLRRQAVLKKLSENLRGRAEKKGMKIDAVFRNANGMNLQYERFRYMMTGRKRGFQGPIPKSFIEAKALYEKDRPAYMKILKDAMPKEKKEALAPTEVPQEAPKINEEVMAPKEETKEAATFSTRLPWDRWEWALLLEAYEEIQKKPSAKMEILQQLSDTLRARAIRQGMQIDDTFRNLNGLDLQYEHVLYIMSEGKQGLKGNLTKGFDEVKHVYLTDKKWFDLILRKAKRDAGIEVSEDEKKKTPITVVNGEVVKTAPDFSKLPINEVPRIHLYRNIYALELSFGLMQKLYQCKVQTIQDLADHMKGDDPGNLSSTECAEIFTKLAKYIDEHKSAGKVDFFGTKSTKEEEKEEAASNSSEKTQDWTFFTDEERKSIPKYVCIQNIHSLAISTELKKQMYSQRVRSIEDLFYFLKNNKEKETISYETWQALYLALRKYLTPFLRKETTDHQVEKKKETKPSKTYIAPKPAPLQVSISEKPSLFGKEEPPAGRAEEKKSPIVKRKRQMSSLPDLLALESLEKDTPVSFSLQGRRIFAASWESLYTYCLRYLLFRYADTFRSLRSQSMYIDQDQWLVRRQCQQRLRKPGELNKEYYVETDLSAAAMLTYLKKVLERCEIDLETFVIETERIEEKEESPASSMKDAQLTCDLEKEKIYEGLTPKSFAYFGDKQEVQGWDDLYSKCASVLYEDYPGVFNELRKECEEGDLLHYVSTTSGVGRTVKLGDHMYLHMGFTPYRMWSFLRYALVKCQVDFENLVVSFAQAEDKPNPAPAVTPSSKDVDIPTIEVAPEIGNPKEPEPVSSPETTLESQIQQVLASHFSGGFDPRNINAKKFQKYFQEIYGHQVPMNLAALIDTIRQVGTLRGDGRIYAKADAEDVSILRKVADALVSLLDGSASIVYRDTLYEKYRLELAALAIYDASMMEGELSKILPSGYVCRYGVYRGKSPKKDGEEVLRFIKASLSPIKEEEVYDQFWYIPQDKVKNILKSDDDILQIKSTWFYYRNISLSLDEEEKLRQRLHNEIWKKDYLSEDDILEILEEDFPGIAADVSTFPPAVVRWSLPMLYPDDFCIVGGNLSDREHAGSAGDALRALCKKHTHLTEGELKGLRDKINFKGNYAGAVMEEMVRVSPDQWVRRDQVHFDHTIPRYIAKYMEGKDCIPLQEVTSFLEFPNVGVKWNRHVLESYLYKNDGLCPFQLLQAAGGVSASGAYGVIVKKGGKISKYKAALIYLLARDDAWETDAEALDRMVAMGLQSDRRMSDIQTITKTARAERNHLHQPQK